jgi:tetratricopeptide (TPR) repeat protein
MTERSTLDKEGLPSPTLANALALLQSGDIAAAATMCGLLLADTPQDPARLQLAATIALRQGDVAKAADLAQSSLDLRPDHAPTLLIAGHAARAAGDLAQALTLFRHVMNLAPSRPDAAFMTCVTLLECGNADAQDLLDLCLRQFPDDAAGWRAIGLALQKAGQNEAALVALTRAARVAPNCELHLRCGALLQKLSRFPDAVAAFRAAQALEPSNFEAALQLGLSLQRLGDPAGARAALLGATALAPQAGRGWFASGLLAQEGRDWPAAIAAYRKALTAEPGLAEAAVNLGIVLQETGALGEARAAYAHALHLRADTFGRIAQALSAAPSGEVWLDLAALRRSLESIPRR